MGYPPGSYPPETVPERGYWGVYKALKLTGSLLGCKCSLLLVGGFGFRVWGLVFRGIAAPTSSALLSGLDGALVAE